MRPPATAAASSILLACGSAGQFDRSYVSEHVSGSGVVGVGSAA
jgi:hypothetical protein